MEHGSDRAPDWNPERFWYDKYQTFTPGPSLRSYQRNKTTRTEQSVELTVMNRNVPLMNLIQGSNPVESRRVIGTRCAINIKRSVESTLGVTGRRIDGPGRAASE